MYRVITVCALATIATPRPALADPPKPLHVVEVAALKAPIDKVWDTVKDFDGPDKWLAVKAKIDLVKGKNNVPGAVRSVRGRNGATVTEQLLEFDATNHTYTYKILESPLPLDHYVSTLTVTEGKGGTTVVKWAARFTRKNTADNPPDAESDAAAVKMVTGIYQGGLANLKKMFAD